MGFNVASARSTASYKEGLTLLKTTSDFKRTAATLKDIQIDIEKDLHALLAVTPSPTSKKGSIDERTIVVSGSFDPKKTIAALTKEGSPEPREIDGMTLYTSGDNEIAILSKELIVIASGKKAYRTESFESLSGASKRKKGPKSLESLIKRVDTSQHLWIAGDLSKASTKSDEPQKIAITLDFNKGLAMQGWMRMEDEEAAQQTIDKFIESKPQIEGFLGAFGAPTLAKNLTCQASDKDVRVAASMPDQEVKALAAAAQGLMRR